MAATLRDVARMVGVSISTVSRALHRPDMVDADTRRKVDLAVAALSYVPQGAGRALVSRRSRSVGAVVPRIGTSAFAATIEALRVGLGKGRHTLLLAQPALSEQPDVRPLRALIEHGVDALVLLGNDYPSTWLELIQNNNLPVVTIWADARDAQPGAIGFDNQAVGQLAAEHLLALGHRDFAMISGYLQTNLRAHRRYIALLETIAARGGRLPRRLVIETEYGFAEGYAAAQQLLRCGEHFTALICGNDYLALGAMAALREHPLRVPEDISVIGFNNSDFAPYVSPPLSTVSFPSVDIGTAAADALLAVLEHGQPMPPPLMLPTPLVQRDSTAPPRQTQRP